MSETLTSKEDGLDMARAREFIELLGLSPDAQIFILDDDDYAIYEERFAALLNTAMSEREGSYAPSANIVAVHRDRALEERFGPAITEYRLIHELAHASAKGQSYLYTANDEAGKDIEIMPGRVGYLTVVAGNREEFSGSYLEEGFADMIAWQYVVEAGITAGFGDNTEPLVLSTMDGVVEVSVDMQIDGDATKAAVATTGLRLLFKEDPTLLESFIAARNDPKAAKEVAVKITNIGQKIGYPTLYRDIWKCGIGLDDFIDTTRKIVLAIDPALAAQWDERDFASENDGDEDEEGKVDTGPTTDTSTAEDFNADLAFIDERINLLLAQAAGRELTPAESQQLDNLKSNRQLTLDELKAALRAKV